MNNGVTYDRQKRIGKNHRAGEKIWVSLCPKQWVVKRSAPLMISSSGGVYERRKSRKFGESDFGANESCVWCCEKFETNFWLSLLYL